MADVDGNIEVSSDVESMPIPANMRPRICTLSVEDADIRYRVTGLDPVGGNAGGHLVAAGSWVTINGLHNIQNLRMIRDAAADAQVFYTLEK